MRLVIEVNTLFYTINLGELPHIKESRIRYIIKGDGLSGNGTVGEKARDGFERIFFQNRDKYNIRQILIELDRKLPLKRKNPTIAGILAIVPGAGHLYCERKRDAFVSFLLNGAMIYAAYEAFDNDLNALGLLPFLSLAFTQVTFTVQWAVPINITVMRKASS